MLPAVEYFVRRDFPRPRVAPTMRILLPILNDSGEGLRGSKYGGGVVHRGGMCIKGVVERCPSMISLIGNLILAWVN